MVQYIVNDAITEIIPEDIPSGETFTISGGTDPAGSTWAGPSITEGGDGYYRATFTPSQTGLYRATITGNTTGQVFTGAWFVVDAPAPAFTRKVNGPTAIIMDTWFNELQQQIERLLAVNGLD